MEDTVFTQEQVNEMIKTATQGLFNEDELNKRVTSEVDRRVESGIKKGIETQKSKWLEEYQAQSNMTAEQIAQKKFEEQLQQVSAKEKEISKKANMLDAKDMLASAGIPKAQYEKVINMLVSDNSESTVANVQNFIDVFNSTKTEIETTVKSQFSNVKPPVTGTGDTPVSKQDFLKMSYAEKLNLKNTNPDLYKSLIK